MKFDALVLGALDLVLHCLKIDHWSGQSSGTLLSCLSTRYLYVCQKGGLAF